MKHGAKIQVLRVVEYFETINDKISIILHNSFLLRMSFYKIKLCNKHIFLVYAWISVTKWLHVDCRKWQSNSAMPLPLFTSAIHLLTFFTTLRFQVPLFISIQRSWFHFLSFANTGLLNMHLIIAKISWKINIWAYWWHCLFHTTSLGQWWRKRAKS